MARPGFVIPNALDAGANLDLAEPDALDFNLLGNLCYGVITGCLVRPSGSGYTVSVDPGVAVVNGVLVLVNGSTTLASPSQTPRFDLITVDGSGAVGYIQGTPSANPIFPAYGTTVTVLASVMVRPGAGYPTTADVIDKRIMLPNRYVTAVKDSYLVRNVDPVDLHLYFNVDFDGRMTWDGDATALSRVGTKTLKVEDNLQVVSSLSAASLSLTGDLNVAGDLIGSNYRQGNGAPSGAATQGDIYRDLNNGNVWVYQGTAWVQLSTVPIPPGMTMMGMMTTAPAGWLLVNGQTVNKATAGGLWNTFPAWQTGPDSFRLPDASNCHYAWGPPGTKFGNPTTQFTLSIANLPAHKHLASPTAGAGGTHTHTIQQQAAGGHAHTTGTMQGAHTHDIYDPGHTHPPPYGYGGYVMTDMQGTNKLDGLFNDASHTFNVTPIRDTGTCTDAYGHGTTGITVTTANSNHQHTTDVQGQHTHPLSIDPGGSSHTHPITENTVGGGLPFDIRPPSFGMYLFIKT
jgi:hypothetical protein